MGKNYRWLRFEVDLCQHWLLPLSRDPLEEAQTSPNRLAMGRCLHSGILGVNATDQGMALVLLVFRFHNPLIRVSKVPCDEDRREELYLFNNREALNRGTEKVTKGISYVGSDT